MGFWLLVMGLSLYSRNLPNTNNLQSNTNNPSFSIDVFFSKQQDNNLTIFL